ncbi:ribosomal protein L22 [Vararia minispora EC-137]|uniref:Ribosomal protein L22 n=1 Tax=Vararia minispora EC-137 TaxID=1314806 RepID=A0ACB8QPD7_9AGAM|nr:ribosomal protein L22 [Vararia minispora EC-137]
MVIVSKSKFVVDYSRPAADGVFDGAAFEKFLHDRIKVDGKPGQLGDSIKIHREGAKQIAVTTSIHFSKRYLKYLTKKFLKKSELSDFMRVTASSKDKYEIKYRGVIANPDEDEDEE